MNQLLLRSVLLTTPIALGVMLSAQTRAEEVLSPQAEVLVPVSDRPLSQLGGGRAIVQSDFSPMSVSEGSPYLDESSNESSLAQVTSVS